MKHLPAMSALALVALSFLPGCELQDDPELANQHADLEDVYDDAFDDVAPLPPAPHQEAFLRVGLEGGGVTSGADFSFEDHILGEEPPEFSFDIFNLGEEPLSFSSTPPAELSGPGAEAFEIVAQPEGPVQWGTPTRLTVRFNPDHSDVFNATLLLHHDAAGEDDPFEIQLQARALIAVPTIVFVGNSGWRVASYDMGESWEPHVADSDHDGNTHHNLHAVMYHDGLFVAVGGWGHGRITVSRDGVTWQDIPPALSNYPAFWGGTHGNGLFLAVGGRAVYTSTDGYRWNHTATVEPSGNFVDVAFGEDRFVAVGWQGLRAMSETGLAWDHAENGGPDLRAVAYGNGRFVAVGANGRRLTSQDGITWDHDLQDDTLGNLSGIVFDGQRFIVTSGSLSLTSPDGIDWQTHSARGPDRTRRYGDIYLGGRWRSDRFLSTDGWDYTQIGGNAHPYFFADGAFGHVHILDPNR